MRRVIYAWNYVEWGGSQIYILSLIREARKSFDVVIALPRGTDSEFLGFLKAEGIRYEEFDAAVNIKPATGLFDKFERHWSKIKSEYQMLRKIEEIGLVDSIVHADILPTQSLTALIWLCIRAEVFITSHNALPHVPIWRWLLWKVKFRIVSRFDSLHVLCSNEHAAIYFRRLFAGKVADDISVTYAGIDPAEIGKALEIPLDRESVLLQIGIPTDKFIVLAVGQFVDRKGRWTFLEAAKQVLAKTDDVVFVWIMPRLPNEADRSKVERFGLGDAFRMVSTEEVGRERQDVFKFYRAADVYALPSLVEGLPISLLQAMAFGLASVSTNVYGIPEAIIDERTGLLIEPDDPPALVDAIIRLKSDEHLRQRLSDAGRKHVISYFDERVAAKTAVAAYISVSR